jgi:hypothetical protein
MCGKKTEARRDLITLTLTTIVIFWKVDSLVVSSGPVLSGFVPRAAENWTTGRAKGGDSIEIVVQG